MKWKRSKKAALESKKGENNNNNTNKEQQHKETSKDGTNSTHNNNTMRENDAALEQLHDVNDDLDDDDDDDIDMDESDIDEDDVIDVADNNEQQSIVNNHQPCANPFMDQTNFASSRDMMPTDLSIRPMSNNLPGTKPPQSQHLLSRV